MPEDKPKRKKTSRACNHCHKAHMTCDTSRPCKRCIQRGLQNSCEDAPRKRKKYLADVPSSLIKDHFAPAPMYPHSDSLPGFSPTPPPLPRSASQPSFHQNHQNQNHQNQNQNQNHQNQNHQNHQNQNYMDLDKQFLSSAANLEYSTLSNIIQDSFMGLYQPSNSGTPVSVSPALSPHGMMLQFEKPARQFPRCDTRINQYFLEPGQEPLPDVIQAIEQLKNADPSVYWERTRKSAISFSVGTNETHPHNGLQYSQPEDIYATITKPFSYTPGFHKLIAYLRSRFPKEMLVQMAESMASYRPSFIACTNSLKEADLIFMEQCFQRTLLTYDNFIKVSGTPTIVWRRTGEIAYVGREFCVLTGWTKEQLLGQKTTLIVELLDDKSVVEYFQLFSRIAFGDFLGATMTECTLLTPKHDVKIRTGCIWTLKRDVFGIPMMIIGNFLPIV